MLRTASLIASLLLALALAAAPLPRRDIKSVKREQKQVEAEVKKTGEALDANARETERNLNRLSVLRRRLDESRAAVAASQQRIDSIDSAIRSRTDSLAALTRRLDRLRKSYAEALRAQQLYPNVNSPIAFIFSAPSVTEAYRRMRYLRQFDAWRSRRTAELNSAAAAVADARRRLEESRSELASAHTRIRSERDALGREQQSTDSLVATLRREGAGLKSVLAEKQRRADALDRELDRLIAEEQARIERERKVAEERRRREAAEREAREKAKAEAEAAAREKAEKATDKSSDKSRAKADDKKKKDKAKEQPAAAPAKPTPAKPAPALDSEAEADRKLTGSFAANKGKLLFPVAGRYRIVRGFGRQPHPELRHVETNNSGIDIEVAPGTVARAIFDGRVSAIFRLPGYANIVMVRHGDYISLYANLSSVNVAKGQEVKAGQTIGRILTGTDDEGGATTLHFEIRRERAKLNPTEWVK